MHKPRQIGPVTAVIPCYNCASTLERAVRSVAVQTVRPAELILVDDSSTDSTLDTIRQVREHYGPDWVRALALEHNSGPASARNAAWNVAKQEYVAFLDADDAWQEGKLEAQLTYMQAHPEVALTSHQCKISRVGEEKDADTTLHSARRLSCGALLISNRIATRTVMLRRELPYRFREGKRYAEDYLLWLQLACDGHRLDWLEAEWAYVFKTAFGEGGLSARLWSMEKGELDAFRQLAAEGRLSRVVALGCVAYSMLKFLRRVVVVMVRRLRMRLGSNAA